MGAYDDAEVCELVGIFMLNKISEKYNKNDVECNKKVEYYIDVTFSLKDRTSSYTTN